MYLKIQGEFGGWGIASMLASDTSLYAISTSDMTVYHYNSVPLGIGDLKNWNAISADPNPTSSGLILEFNLNVA